MLLAGFLACSNDLWFEMHVQLRAGVLGPTWDGCDVMQRSEHQPCCSQEFCVLLFWERYCGKGCVCACLISILAGSLLPGDYSTAIFMSQGWSPQTPLNLWDAEGKSRFLKDKY